MTTIIFYLDFSVYSRFRWLWTLKSSRVQFTVLHSSLRVAFKLGTYFREEMSFLLKNTNNSKCARGLEVEVLFICFGTTYVFLLPCRI